MWDFLTSVTARLPIGFIEALIIAAVMCAIWVLPRLRRDKAGKVYVYSRGYEEHKQRSKAQGEVLGKMKAQMDAFIENNEKTQIELKKGNKRLELLRAIDHTPDDESTILRLADECKDLGVNSYVDDVVERWKKGNRK